MLVIPAIDLKDGQCVRLIRGDFATAHRVAADPLETARGFEACGAELIHIVDLDGALKGERVNGAIIREIVEKTSLKVETGGGIRRMEDIDRLAASGVYRVILGSAAVKDPVLVGEAVLKYGRAIAVGIDAREGRVRTEGWTEASGLDYIEFAREMAGMGVENLILTDISRDGTLEGPNFDMLRELSSAVPCLVTASGGVHSIGDIRRLRDMGLYAAIAGKAVYAGTLDLAEAVLAAKQEGK